MLEWLRFMARNIPAPFIALVVALALSTLACKAVVGSPVFRDRTLFRDDFDDPSSGWNRVTAPKGETDYADGMYRIFVNDLNMDVWSQAGLDYTDARIEVDAIKVSGSRNNRFGIICRAESPTRFYTLIISSDGYYGIGYVDGPHFSLLGMNALQPTDAIHPGSALNHLRADCIGQTLTLYVNGAMLAVVKDDRLASGDVGLIAGSYSEPGIDIRFDNFVVSQP